MSTVQKWGNSLAIRIPHALAGKLDVCEGTTVELEVQEGKLVVRPITSKKLSLAELLRNCKPSQLHREIDFGSEVGREVID